MGFAVLPVDGAMLVDYVHSYPAFVVFLGKVLLGAPFFYHCFNGFRHLVYLILIIDVGHCTWIVHEISV